MLYRNLTGNVYQSGQFFSHSHNLASIRMQDIAVSPAKVVTKVEATERRAEDVDGKKNGRAREEEVSGM